MTLRKKNRQRAPRLLRVAVQASTQVVLAVLVQVVQVRAARVQAGEVPDAEAAAYSEAAVVDARINRTE